MGNDIAELANASVLVSLLLWLLSGALIAAMIGLGYYLTSSKGSRSPFSGNTMLRGSDLTFEAVSRLQAHLAAQGQPENRDFDPLKAAACKHTGRVFTDAIGRLGVIHIPRNYLSRRYPGTYVAWRELADSERQAVLAQHSGIGGFEPAGLYADMNTKILLGWQHVPETGLEILVVQKPDNARQEL